MLKYTRLGQIWRLTWTLPNTSKYSSRIQQMIQHWVARGTTSCSSTLWLEQVSGTLSRRIFNWRCWNKKHNSHTVMSTTCYNCGTLFGRESTHQRRLDHVPSRRRPNPRGCRMLEYKLRGTIPDWVIIKMKIFVKKELEITMSTSNICLKPTFFLTNAKLNKSINDMKRRWT